MLEVIGDSLFTVLIDETTDFSNTIDMDVHIRWVQLVIGNDGRKRFCVREDFLCMLPLKNGTAETIYSSLITCLHANGLDPRKCVSFGSDGASTMTGDTSGAFVSSINLIWLL